MRATAREGRQCGEVTADQRLLLFAAPPFDLTLCRDGVLNAVEFLVKHKVDRTPVLRVAAEMPGIALGDPTFKAAARAAHIVRAIAAAEHIYECCHARILMSRRVARPTSFETPPAAAPQDEDNARPHPEERSEGSRLEG